MFDYAQEALAHSITAENAEYREELLQHELLATRDMMEGLRVVTPAMRKAGKKAKSEWAGSASTEPSVEVAIYLAMLEAA